jgi:hypothetical protein
MEAGSCGDKPHGQGAPMPAPHVRLVPGQRAMRRGSVAKSWQSYKKGPPEIAFRDSP